jgi:hypothetical protein
MKTWKFVTKKSAFFHNEPQIIVNPYKLLFNLEYEHLIWASAGGVLPSCSRHCFPIQEIYQRV